jgi:hypothetical protein
MYEIQIVLSKLVAKKLSPVSREIEAMEIQPYTIDSVGWFQDGKGKWEKSVSIFSPVVGSPIIFSRNGARDMQEFVTSRRHVTMFYICTINDLSVYISFQPIFLLFRRMVHGTWLRPL